MAAAVSKPGEEDGAWLRHFSFLVDFQQSWVLIALLGVMFLAGATVLSAMGDQLVALHVGGSEGFRLEQFWGSSLNEAVPTWKNAWEAFNRTRSFAGAAPYVSPRHLATKSIELDFGLFIIPYLFGGLAILLRGHRRVTKETVRPWIRAGIVALIAVALLDTAENVMMLRLLDWYWDAEAPIQAHGLQTVLGMVTGLKWMSVVPVLVAFVLLGIAVATEPETKPVTPLRLFRPQIAVAVVTFILLGLPIQLADLLARIDAAQAVGVAVAAIILALTLFSASRLVADAFHDAQSPPTPTPPPAPPAPPWPLLLAMFAVPVAIALFNCVTRGNVWVPLIPLGIMLFILVGGVPLKGLAPAQQKAPRDAGRAALTVPQTLAAVVLVAGGLAALRVMVLLWVEGGDYDELRNLGVALMGGALVVPWVIYHVELLVTRRSLSSPVKLVDLACDMSLESRTRRRIAYGIFTGLAIAAVIVVAVSVLREPTTAQALGAITIVLMFLTALGIVVSGLVLAADWWTDRYGTPIALRPRFKTIPVFTILFIWGLLAAGFDDGTHWEIRTLPRDTAIGGMSLEDAFELWTDAAEDEFIEEANDAVPLVIVATSGGGIRSAYWTALALDCLFLGQKAATASDISSDPCRSTTGEADRSAALFLASGISGGSLGLVAWDANPRSEAGGRWVEERLGADFVAPSMAQGLFVEIPRSFFHFRAPGRAEALENAWEQTWDGGADGALGQGFLSTQQTTAQAGGPFLILNGASILDGCGLSVSILDEGSSVDQSGEQPSPALRGGDCTSVSRYTNIRSDQDPPGALPATLDLVDYLTCAEKADVRRSTAALLSARFPYVSSAGQLRGCADGPATKFILDGGYVDTSAAETAMSLWMSLDRLIAQRRADGENDPCIVPYFVQIDNNYEPTLSPRAQPKPPNQLVAPLTGLMATNGLASRAARARTMAALTFTQPLPGESGHGNARRYQLIAPRAHPGVQAPLGWTLSEEAKRDLEAQLYVANAGTITEVRKSLVGELDCPYNAEENSAHQ